MTEKTKRAHKMYPCPKGCGEEFQTPGAAGSHGRWCKHIPEVEEAKAPEIIAPGASPPPEIVAPGTPLSAGPAQEVETPATDPGAAPPSLLDPSAGLDEFLKPPGDGPAPPAPAQADIETRIVNTILPTMLSQIEAGMGVLQERTIETIMTRLSVVLPAMIGQQVGNMGYPSTGDVEGDSAGAKQGLMALTDWFNEFLKTPLGKQVERKLFGPGPQSPRGNPNQWRQGAQLATKMITSNKGDPESTAASIVEFTRPYVNKPGNDMFRAMSDVANMLKTKGGNDDKQTHIPPGGPGPPASPPAPGATPAPSG